MTTLAHTQTAGVNAKRVTMIGRREFIAGLGGAAAAWPLAARAQQPALPLVGIIDMGRVGGPFRVQAYPAFHRGLNETGYIEGRNVAIEIVCETIAAITRGSAQSKGLRFPR